MHQANTGIRNQLAKGDNNPQRPNHQAPKAPIPKESINWARHQDSLCPTMINVNKANTAPNDNQKLGSATLKGAHSKTPKHAYRKQLNTLTMRPRVKNHIMARHITKALWVGKEKPAKAAYITAASMA